MNTINELERKETIKLKDSDVSFLTERKETTQTKQEMSHDDRDEGFMMRLNALSEEAGGISKLAMKTGIPYSSLRKWINGESEPNRARLVKIARGCGVYVEWLATGTGPREPQEGRPYAISRATEPADAPASAAQAAEKLRPHPSPFRQNSRQSRDETPPPTGYPLAHHPGDHPMRPPGLPPDLPRLAACLEAVQQLQQLEQSRVPKEDVQPTDPSAPNVPIGHGELIDAQRQLTLAYAMLDFIYYLRDQGHQPDVLDRDDLLALARMLNKAIAAS